MNIKEPFQVVDTTVYQLEFDSWHKGVEQQRNRVYANVQGYRDTPKEELEATARLFAAASEMFGLLKESKESIGGDWRQRRDEIISKLENTNAKS